MNLTMPTSATASGSANFNATVISVFSFGETTENEKSFNIHKGSPNRKLYLPKYHSDIEPVESDRPKVASDEVSLIGDAS